MHIPYTQFITCCFVGQRLYYNITMLNAFLIELAAKKFWPPARARRKGGVGGIPPRPSVPPERSGGGQFRSKNVRAELYNSTYDADGGAGGVSVALKFRVTMLSRGNFLPNQSASLSVVDFCGVSIYGKNSTKMSRIFSLSFSSTRRISWPKILLWRMCSTVWSPFSVNQNGPSSLQR